MIISSFHPSFRWSLIVIKSSIHFSSPRFSSIRYLDIENLIGARKVIGSLRVSRLAKSVKFCKNFDRQFVENITPTNGEVVSIIPKGSVLRATEYAFAMSFE
ncbi:hypothetical protein MXB_3557 [Myxobolus squamalis]|nr:hypothetical protein MXB_3557 [Myxobolus squamalis]